MDPRGQRTTSGSVIASVVALGIAAAGAGIADRYERRAAPSDPAVVLVRHTRRDHRRLDMYQDSQIQIFPRVPFRPGSAEVWPEAREAIDSMVTTLAHNHTIALLELGGYTDDRAGVAGSLALSRRRVDAVRDYLVSRGVDGGRLEACPYGQGRPLVRNDTAAHRVENNRITYLVLSTQMSPSSLVVTAATASDPPRQCPEVPALTGAALVFGDQDRDQDGVPNPVDHCPSERRAERSAPRQPNCPGCLRTDLDGDGVPDDEDACRSELPGAHPDRNRPGCPDGDVDGDQVFDSHDACPNRPPGPRSDPAPPGCPAPDRDGDTVADAVDLCPDVNEGSRPDPTREGCPIADRDHDTVADSADACVEEPGAPSMQLARSGCPGLVSVAGERLAVTGPLTFAPGAARWDAAGNATVDAIADAVLASRWVYRVSVVGHAETAALALRRAEMVADQMAARGVPPCDVEAFGVVTTEGAAPAEAVEFVLVAQRQPFNAGSSGRSLARHDPPRQWR